MILEDRQVGDPNSAKVAPARDADTTGQGVDDRPPEKDEKDAVTARQSNELADADETAGETVQDGKSSSGSNNSSSNNVVIAAPSSSSSSSSSSPSLPTTTTTTENAATTAPPSPTASSPATTPRRGKQPRHPHPPTSAPPAPTMPPSTGPVALLVCSIGNPGAAYAHTLHSAGHTLVQALGRRLGAPAFAKDRALGNGLAARLPSPAAAAAWTLWQSPAYMNESGKPVAAAWRAFARGGGGGGGGDSVRLVVVHDELEKPLGAVSVRDAAGLSARGHNGLKSVLQHLGKEGFVRVGVGIGRPVSRERDDVSNYVLKKMTPTERDKIEGAADDLIGRLMAMSGD
ncbi:hypothetical protein MBLNU459_g5258t1 [Dothideomycetes sp. NU459]